MACLFNNDIVFGVNFPNVYGVNTVESLEMFYFSLKHSHIEINKEGSNIGSKLPVYCVGVLV